MATGTINLVRDGKTGSPMPGDSIKEGDILETGEQSMAVIEWGTSYVKVWEKARITWDQIRKNHDSNALITEISIPAGSLLVKTSLKLFRGESLNVKSSTAVASVRGTEMRFIQYENASRVECIEGKVRVAHAHTDRGAVFLGAGQAAIVEPGKEIQIVPIEDINASINGSPSFRRSTGTAGNDREIRRQKESDPGDGTVNKDERSTALLPGSKDTAGDREKNKTGMTGKGSLTDKPDVDMPSLR
jgi:hypothetical protein